METLDDNERLALSDNVAEHQGEDEEDAISQPASRKEEHVTAFGLTLTGPPLSAVEPPFPHILLLIRGWRILFNPPYLMCVYDEIIASIVR